MADATNQPKRPSRRSGVVIPNRPRWHQRFAALMIFLFERLLTCTLRVRWHDQAGLATGKIQGPVICCLWHNRLAMCMLAWRGYGQKHSPVKKLAALISASKDGALLSATLDRFGVESVRGSSSRRGPQALLELTSALERGVNVAITPDGPRGPCYRVQPGAVALAQISGVPVLPLSFHLSHKLSLKSWDRFQLPLPFARCEITFGAPLTCPRDATEAQRETFRSQLETAMKEIARD